MSKLENDHLCAMDRTYMSQLFTSSTCFTVLLGIGLKFANSINERLNTSIFAKHAPKECTILWCEWGII